MLDEVRNGRAGVFVTNQTCRMADQFDPATHPHRRCTQRPCFSYPKIIEILTNPLEFSSQSADGRLHTGFTSEEESTVARLIETSQPTTLPQYDPKYYLCPGNEHANGQRDEIYEHTTVFDNDYASVLPPNPIAHAAPHPLLITQPVHGQCGVLTFHPRHELTLARLAVEDIARIVEEWIAI